MKPTSNHKLDDEKDLFNPKESFFELKIVRNTTYLILFVAAVISLSILISGNYSVNTSAVGWNTLLSDFKVPIGCVTALIPVIAVYAAQHRSRISLLQIKQAEAQNNFSNYYKHYEMFEEHIKSSLKKDSVSKFEPYSLKALYQSLYPNNSHESLNVNLDIDTIVSNSIVEFGNSLYALFQYLTTPQELREGIDPIHNKFHCIQSLPKSFGVKFSEGYLLSIYNSEAKPLYRLLQDIDVLIKDIWRFSENRRDEDFFRITNQWRAFMYKVIRCQPVVHGLDTQDMSALYDNVTEALSEYVLNKKDS